MTEKPGLDKGLAAAGALMWLIPIVVILAVLFVALLWAALGWWTLAAVAVAGWFVQSRSRRR